MLDRSIMALLLGLLRTDLLANDISAVTRVIEILKNHFKIHKYVTKWSLITFSSAVVYCDLVWIPPPGVIIHYRAELMYLTGHQICAWGSQRALSASCLLPAYKCTIKYCQNCLILHYTRLHCKMGKYSMLKTSVTSFQSKEEWKLIHYPNADDQNVNVLVIMQCPK